MNVWNDFELAQKCIFRLINGKRVILWGGYEYNTYFLEHLFRINYKMVDMIVSDEKVHPRIPITRSCELIDVSPRNSFVVITCDRDGDIEGKLSEMNFQKDRDYVYAKELFLGSVDSSGNVSYFGYLENRFKGVDISEHKTFDVIDKPREDCLEYSPGIGYGLADVLEQFSFDQTDAVFDFGCGKGGALILFEKYGCRKLGGVEYDKELYNICRDNFRILGLDGSGIINGDTVNVTNALDSYNYFFMYNPFEGDTFRRTILNIEESYRRKKREITLIYSGPYCHEMVVRDGYFELTKRVYTDYSVRYVNIYRIS